MVKFTTVDTDVVVPAVALTTDTSVTNGRKSSEQNPVASKLMSVGLRIFVRYLHEDSGRCFTGFSYC